MAARENQRKLYGLPQWWLERFASEAGLDLATACKRIRSGDVDRSLLEAWKRTGSYGLPLRAARLVVRRKLGKDRRVVEVPFEDESDKAEHYYVEYESGEIEFGPFVSVFDLTAAVLEWIERKTQPKAGS